MHEKSPNRHRASLAVGVFGGLVFLALGVWILKNSLHKVELVGQSETWPTVDGFVIRSGVTHDDKSPRPDVEYRYEVAGRQFESHQIGFDVFFLPGGRGKLESIVNRYPMGSKVAVHYQPDDPAVAILEPGDYSKFYMPVFFGILFVFNAAFVFWISWKGRKGPRQQVSVRPCSTRSILSATVATAIVIYIVLILATLDSACQEVFVKAFGRPFGLPTPLFAAGLLTLLFIPVPWIFWHVHVILQNGSRNDIRMRALSRWIDASNLPEKNPGPRRSLICCLIGLAYYVIIAAAWLTYCGVRGI
ncbi:MAG TPA: DUF3592 domain-containing protein [Lacipirellulaceae bacterium]